MTISELEQVLAGWRKCFGDVEVNEALHEYGWRPLTAESVETFIRIETITYRDGRPTERNLVIGRH